jgi:recombination protein RecT
MSKADVDKVRAQSKAGKSGPWVTHYTEMARKTVVRRLFKYLPVSIEIQRAVTIDEQADANVMQDHNIYDGTYEHAEDPAYIDQDTGEIKDGGMTEDEKAAAHAREMAEAGAA